MCRTASADINPVRRESIMATVSIVEATQTDQSGRWADSLVRAVLEEFAEMPCMRLTHAQFRRLWHLAPDESERLVADLIAIGFLAEDQHGRVCRAFPLH
jgi:hypothetical protein